MLRNCQTFCLASEEVVEACQHYLALAAEEEGVVDLPTIREEGAGVGVVEVEAEVEAVH
jgi:hypothetical protein